ncbi:MAG TPA: glycosyltransferase [Herpetosiphonaceae bacterium]|nr:glycosyltransferase [Herpetosiphonaceae bacterium]
MKILAVHNHYQIRGGEDESFEVEVNTLRGAGHEVVTYTQDNERVERIGRVRTAARTVWSQQTYREVRRVLADENIGLVHVQNFFPLISPSVYYAGRTARVPVVQTLRNYRLLCPNSLFFRDGHVCEDCMGKFVPWPGIVHTCYRDSKTATATVGGMITIHRLLRTWDHMVDLYVALTEFARKKFIQGGIPADKIVVKPNCVYPDPGIGGGAGGYILFVGRLSAEKGVSTLLDAWQQVGRGRRLCVVGEGPLRSVVEEASRRMPEIEYLGRQDLAEVYRLMGDAKAVVFPSEWYETFGRVAIEAFAKQTPVVAARIGAIAEVVDDGRTGLLFEPGNVGDLCRQLEWVWSHPGAMVEMGQEARREYEAKYTASRNYEMLMEIYELARIRADDRLRVS